MKIPRDFLPIIIMLALNTTCQIHLTRLQYSFGTHVLANQLPPQLIVLLTVSTHILFLQWQVDVERHKYQHITFQEMYCQHMKEVV